MKWDHSFAPRSNARGFFFMKRFEQYMTDFNNALSALRDGTGAARSDLEIDGAIQRFEFTYELFWKLLKSYLQLQGILANTPKESFKEAFRIGLLEDQDA